MNPKYKKTYTYKHVHSKMHSHLEMERVKRELWQDVENYTYVLPVDVNIQ